MFYVSFFTLAILPARVPVTFIIFMLDELQETLLSLFHSVLVSFQPPVLHKEFVEMGEELHASELLGELHLMLVVEIHIELHVTPRVQLHDQGLEDQWSHLDLLSQPFHMVGQVSLHTRLVTVESVLLARVFDVLAGVRVVNVRVAVVAPHHDLRQALLG